MMMFRERVETECVLDLEQTPEFLYAHAIPEYPDIGPGDIVVVHDAPDGIAFGQKLSVRRTATIYRAGYFARWWAKASGFAMLSELYEVGFTAKEAQP